MKIKKNYHEKIKRPVLRPQYKTAQTSLAQLRRVKVLVKQSNDKRKHLSRNKNKQKTQQGKQHYTHLFLHATTQVQKQNKKK